MTWEFKTLRERILDWCCSFWGFYVGLCPHSSTVSVLGGRFMAIFDIN